MAKNVDVVNILHEYEANIEKMTELGHGLIPHVQNLVNWAMENMQDILDYRKKTLKNEG